MGPKKVDPKASFMDFFKNALQENMKKVIPGYMDYFKSING
jgi:hypothetical protein